MEMSESPFFRMSGAEDKTSAHIPCKCEALDSLRHAYLGSFFLEPEYMKGISLGANWNFSKGQGSHELIWGTKGPSFKA